MGKRNREDGRDKLERIEIRSELGIKRVEEKKEEERNGGKR